MPLHSGQVLRSGMMYSMTAIPSPGQRFLGWSRLNVFEMIETVVNESGTSSTVTNTVVSPIPGFIPQRILKFQATAPEMILNVPGVETIIKIPGWQANFSGAD